jgi:hypothetical protein
MLDAVLRMNHISIFDFSRRRRLGREFVSPYIGEAESEKAFGGKLFGQSRL